MARSRCTLIVFRSLVVFVVLLLPNFVLAQGPDWETKAGTLGRPKNPKVNRSNHAVRTPIEAGNAARDKNDYYQALIDYESAKRLNPKEPRAYYGAGNVYSDLSCYDSAIEQYLKAIKIKNDFYEAHNALGSVYVVKGRYEDADKEFRAVLSKRRDDIDANIGLALLLTNREKYSEAVAHLNSLTASRSIDNPGRARTYVALGAVYSTEMKTESAIEQFHAAINLDPDLVNAHLWLGSAKLSLASLKLACAIKITPRDLENLGSLTNEAVAHLEKAREIGISKGSEEIPLSLYLLLAQAFAYQKRYDEAFAEINTYSKRVAQLEQQVKQTATGCGKGLDELKAKGHYEIGYVFQIAASFQADPQIRAQLRDKAIEEGLASLKSKPNYAIAHFLLGNLYANQGKYDTAIEAYTSALVSSFPQSIKANLYWRIGLQHLGAGHRAQALQNFQEAVERDPNSPDYHESVASIYVVEGNLDGTFAELSKSAELRAKIKNCEKPDPYYYFGATYAIRYLKTRSESDFEQAVKWLKKATEISRDYALAHKALGTVYWHHRDADLALASYEEAIRIDQKDPLNYTEQARMYSELKHNDDAAINALKKAIEMKPEEAEVYFTLGLIHLRKANSEEAVKQFLLAIKRNEKYLDPYLEVAAIYRTKKNYNEALKYLNQALSFAATDFRLHKELAKLYEAQKENSKAVQSYETSIRLLTPADQYAKELYQCRIKRLTGKFTEAVACFEATKQLPGDVPGLLIFEVGLVHVASGNKQAAQAHYEQLKKMQSTLADELLGRISEMD